GRSDAELVVQLRGTVEDDVHVTPRVVEVPHRIALVVRQPDTVSAQQMRGRGQCVVEVQRIGGTVAVAVEAVRGPRLGEELHRTDGARDRGGADEIAARLDVVDGDEEQRVETWARRRLTGVAVELVGQLPARHLGERLGRARTGAGPAASTRGEGDTEDE